MQMYHTWELMDRTQQLDVQRGPTTMRFTKGNHGNMRMNMERHTGYVIAAALERHFVKTSYLPP